MFQKGQKTRGSVICFILFLFFIIDCKAVTPPNAVYHLSPSHWYTGFKDSFLEIIFHAENADLLDIKMEDYPGVEFLGKSNSANRHVAYIQLNIGHSAQPGLLQFTAKPASRRVRYVKQFKFTYELKVRTASPLPLKQEDVIYHMNLDHFLNGNERNDRTQLKNAYDFNINDPAARHGGDLAGLTNGLTYLHDLGISAIWLNQIQENDVPVRSSNGRSVTNHYLVDPRYGTNDQISALQTELQKTGIKLFMDLDLNQVGWFHWMNLNFDTGWFHSPDSSIHPLPDPEFLNYPGLSQTEKSWISNHWMDPTLPDLNQTNPHIRIYLKQFCLWWSEFAGISAWILPDPQLNETGFNEWIQYAVQHEFPKLTFIANTKTNSMIAQAGYVRNVFNSPFKNSFNEILDYSLYESLNNIAKTDTCDRKYWNDLFNVLSAIEIYRFPTWNLIFTDELNGKGISGSFQKNKTRWKMLLGLQFALPGIPVINSGCEQLSRATYNKGSAYATGCFAAAKSLNNLTQLSGSADFTLVKKYNALRHNNATLNQGSMILYAPADGIFSFFRIQGDKKILVLVNDNPNEKMVLTGRFSDQLIDYSEFKDLISGDKGLLGDYFIIPSQTTLIYELTR